MADMLVWMKLAPSKGHGDRDLPCGTMVLGMEVPTWDTPVFSR